MSMCKIMLDMMLMLMQFTSQNIVDFDHFSYAAMVMLSIHIQELRQLKLPLKLQFYIVFEFLPNPCVDIIYGYLTANGKGNIRAYI